MKTRTKIRKSRRRRRTKPRKSRRRRRTKTRKSRGRRRTKKSKLRRKKGGHRWLTIFNNNGNVNDPLYMEYTFEKLGKKMKKGNQRSRPIYRITKENGTIFKAKFDGMHFYDSNKDNIVLEFKNIDLLNVGPSDEHLRHTTNLGIFVEDIQTIEQFIIEFDGIPDDINEKINNLRF